MANAVITNDNEVLLPGEYIYDEIVKAATLDDDGVKYGRMWAMAIMDSCYYEQMADDEYTEIVMFSDGYIMSFDEEYLSDVRYIAWCDYNDDAQKVFQITR